LVMGVFQKPKVIHTTKKVLTLIKIDFNIRSIQYNILNFL